MSTLTLLISVLGAQAALDYADPLQAVLWLVLVVVTKIMFIQGVLSLLRRH